MLNFCQNVVGYIDGLGLDPADISPQDMLDIGVCYQRLPGCRSSRTQFIPIDQITDDDVDPLWREVTSCDDQLWDDSELNDTEDDTRTNSQFVEHWDSDEVDLDAESKPSTWNADPADEFEADQDRKIVQESLKLKHDISWADPDCKLRRIDSPDRENRRRQPALHQLPLHEDMPLL